MVMSKMHRNHKQVMLLDSSGNNPVKAERINYTSRDLENLTNDKVGSTSIGLEIQTNTKSIKGRRKNA
jgi:hypothetical protein